VVYEGVAVLGSDPGFSMFGWSVVGFSPSPDELMDLVPQAELMDLVPLELGLIRTEKSAKKRSVRAADDNTRRAQEIVRELQKLFVRYQIKAICAESMSFPRNASVAAKMALSWGVLATLSVVHGVPILQASPKEVKVALTGNGSASKLEVQRALDARFDRRFSEEMQERGLSRTTHEHPYDALAAVVACESESVMTLLRSNR
jgi:Holliday junction resolvasome RuvABC endonuclease subunit